MTTQIRQWYERNEWRNPYQQSEVPALGMAALCGTSGIVGLVFKGTKMSFRTLGTAVIAGPLYAATYYKMHGDGSDVLKYEPALLASASVVGMNFHHAVSSAKTVPTVGVIAAAGVGMYYFKSWRYTRAYLGKDWKAYFR